MPVSEVSASEIPVVLPRSDLVRVSWGVWLPSMLAGERLARLAAVLAALPAGAVLSGRTAAQLHGLWVPRQESIDITMPARARPPDQTSAPQRRDVVAHRRRLGRDEVVRLAGLPVTSVARTWWDLASELGLADLVAAGDSALRARLTSRDGLGRVVDNSPRRRGSRLARLALSLLDDRPRSRPESHARVALRTGGLPPPEVNAAVYDEAGGWLAEPDLSYPAARVAIEYQGADHADVRRLAKDAARMMDLQRPGWIVFYYTAAQVFGRPDLLADDVRAALLRRAPQLLVQGVDRVSTGRPGRPRPRTA